MSDPLYKTPKLKLWFSMIPMYRNLLNVIMLLLMILSACIITYIVLTISSQPTEYDGRNIFSMDSDNRSDSYIIAVDPPTVHKSYIEFLADNKNKFSKLQDFKYPDYSLKWNFSLFDSELWTIRIIPFMVLIVSGILMAFCILFKIVTNDIYDSQKEIKYVNTEDTKYLDSNFYTLFMIIAISGVLVFNTNKLYWEANKVYDKAISEIPLEINKEEYKNSDLRTKYKLVNSYLCESIKYDKPLMYSIREGKYLPFDGKRIRTNNIVESQYYNLNKQSTN